MDLQEIKNALIDRFNNLQTEIQAIIMDPGYDETIIDIAHKYQLSDDQQKKLELNTTLVLLGNTHPDDYIEELTRDLKLPKETLDQIAQEVDARVLNSVKDTIKKNFDDDRQEDEEQEKVPTPPGTYEASTENTLGFVKSTDPRISRLPENIQQAIAKSGYQQKLKDIVTKHKLPATKTQAIEDAVLKLVSKTFSVNQFEGTLIFLTNVEVSVAKEITHEVNQTIVDEIQKRASGEIKDEEKKEEPTQVAPVVKIEPQVAAPVITPQEKEPVILKEEQMSASDKGVLSNAGIEMDEGIKQTNSITSKLLSPTRTVHTVVDRTIPKIHPPIHAPEVKTETPIPADPKTATTTIPLSTKDPYREEPQ
jgi:hypothetical protein